MIIPLEIFSILIYGAVIITAVTPVVMLALLTLDMRKDKLW